MWHRVSVAMLRKIRGLISPGLALMIGLRKTCGWMIFDSLATVNLLIDVEKEFGIAIRDLTRVS